MLSRRNVRIKSLQALYAKSHIEDQSSEDAVAVYHSLLDRTFSSLAFVLYASAHVAEYVVILSQRKKSKHLPSDLDLSFSDALGRSNVVQSILRSVDINKQIAAWNLASQLEESLTKSLLQAWLDSESGKIYLSAENLEDEGACRDALISIAKFLLKSDSFDELLHDLFPTWADDKSLILGATKKILKSTPVSDGFLSSYEPSGETVDEYGVDLIWKTSHHNDTLTDLIEPYLKNWDIERLAELDLIILKMAVCEFLHFPTIPTSVTMNEFLEVIKRYSTHKSKEFINGILDTMKTKFLTQGLIKKEGRGLIQE